MNEFEIKFDLKSPQLVDEKIVISVGSTLEENLLYKFFVGLNGKWSILKDFSKETEVQWQPLENGLYNLMVQARRENEQKPFNYISKVDYTIGEKSTNIITNIILEREEVVIGEKMMAKVETLEKGILFKYSIKENERWTLLKDYSADDTMTWTATKSGEQELVVHCKLLDSKEKFNDTKNAKFNVLPIKKIEITDFKCISEELLMNSEICFEVEVDSDDSRLLLYKFIKINLEGEAECIQNYSTKKVVSYIENSFGEYRILCMVKDMYSPNEYDERAIINYDVKKYRPVKIVSLTSEVTSPQIVDTEINLKTVATGGNKLVYRYIIEGGSEEDSGYIRYSHYSWKPKVAGNYKIRVLVKDFSSEEEYEDVKVLEFAIDEENRDPVVLKEIIMDNKEKLLLGETVNIKAIAEGGVDLKYCFIVKYEEKILESISYGSCNWVNYTPEHIGDFELEIRVKDKYSKKEFDAHSIIYIKVLDYIPAKIDYVLVPSNDYYMVGDTIELNVVADNSINTFNKYILKINGHVLEETEYEHTIKYIVKPRYAGTYTMEILSRNIKSLKEYDDKKHIKLVINDSLPVTSTVIECDKLEPKLNEAISFEASSEGGKELVYEFYLMEKNEWSLVQKYSRKNFYTFIPFVKGKYKVLTLCKSQIKKCSYEDYSIIDFEVEN